MITSKKGIIGGLMIFAILIAFAFKSNYSGEKIIIIRTFEPVNKSLPARLIVTNGEATIKTIDLDPIRSQYLESNATKIASALNEYKAQGYQIIAAFGGEGSADTFGMSTFILDKK
jgi:hypothetical protein